MKKFTDLEFKKHISGNGVQAKMAFDNGFDISVIKCAGSYGGEDGLYEMAIYYGKEITYNTHITDDVLGHQTEDDITKAMKDVQLLTE